MLIPRSNSALFHKLLSAPERVSGTDRGGPPRLFKRSKDTLSKLNPLYPAYLCSLAFGVMTRWITKWTQWVDGLCQLYKFPDPGGDVVGPAYVGLYGSSVLV